MHCLECQYSRVKIIDAQNATQFICTRHPPAAAAIPVPTPHGLSVNVMTLWPSVTANDVCGEYLPNLKVVN
jgi:hypothetical protein